MSDEIEEQDSALSPKKKGFMGLTFNMTAGRWLMVGVGGVSLLTAFGAIWLETRGAHVDAGADVNMQANNGIHNAPGKSSPAYAAEVAAYNKKKAAYALSHDQSFVGIPVTGTTTMNMPPQQAPIQQPSAQVQQAPIQETQQASQQQPQSPAADGAIAKEIGAIATAMKNQRGVNPGYYIPQFQRAEPSMSAVSAAGLTPVAETSSSTPSAPPAIPPGSILYGVFENALKSTMPGPVIGELVQGKYNGDRVIGSFTRTTGSDHLEIRLHTLVLPSGKTVAIDAYAISPNTTLPGMATNVNYHILSRTANFLGAAFLAGVEGYGAAVAQEGSTTTSALGIGTTQTYPMLTPAQTMDIAAGQAAQQLQPVQEAMANNVMEPNTITVAQGTPFGLLVVSSGKTAARTTVSTPVISSPVQPATTGNPAVSPTAQSGYPAQRNGLSFPGLTLNTGATSILDRP